MNVNFNNMFYNQRRTIDITKEVTVGPAPYNKPKVTLTVPISSDPKVMSTIHNELSGNVN